MKVPDGDTDVFDAQQVCFLKHVQRVVHPLTRESRKMTDFFLRNLQVTVGTRIKLWVEKGCQTLRHAGFGIPHAIAVDQGNHLREALVELIEDKSIEGNAIREQPVERATWHCRDAGIAQCDRVVPAQFALQ